MMKKILASVVALTFVTTFAHSNDAPTEGVARQVSALKTVLESYRANVDARITAVESTVTTLQGTVSSMETCANASRVYAPTNPSRDANDCIDVGGFSVISGNLAHPGNGGTLVFNHGLGVMPTSVEVDAVNIAPQGGYGVGDKIYNLATTANTADRWHDTGFMVYANNNNTVRVRVSPRGTMGVMRTGGTVTPSNFMLSPASWRFIVKVK